MKEIKENDEFRISTLEIELEKQNQLKEKVARLRTNQDKLDKKYLEEEYTIFTN